MDEMILLGESLEAMKDMPDRDAGALIKSLIRHMEGEEPEKLPVMAKALYPLIKGQVDRIAALNKKNRENGKKGGRPKKTQTETQTKPNENPNETQMKPNANPDNDNDNDIEKIYKKKRVRRNPKIQRAYGYSTERTDVDYNKLALEMRKQWEAE